MSELYYSVSRYEDVLTSHDQDEAVQDWLENAVYDEPLESLPDTVEVFEWEPVKVTSKSNCFKWALEGLLENLDENYTYEDFIGDYNPSRDVVDAYEEFKELLVKDFKPSILQRTGRAYSVDLKQWLKDNNWES